MATTISPLYYLIPGADASLTNTSRILLKMKKFDSDSGNSGKRKMKEVVRPSSKKSPLPPAKNQSDLFRFNAGSRGDGTHFPSPINFPPPSNGPRFASPTNRTPLFNGHRFPFPSSSNPLTKDHNFASTSNFISPSEGRHRSEVERILNSAAPTVRPYSFTSLLMADHNQNDHQDPMATEIRSQSEKINQIITTHAKLLGNAVTGMLERQHKSLHEQANKKLKQREAELEMKSAHNEDLEKKAEHYKKEAQRLSDRVKYMEDYTESLKLCMDYSEANWEDYSSSMRFIHPDKVGGAILVECMVCDTQLASVMMLPCRHVSVCKRCNDVTKACPVCRRVKLASAEAVLWPL